MSFGLISLRHYFEGRVLVYLGSARKKCFTLSANFDIFTPPILAGFK